MKMRKLFLSFVLGSLIFETAFAYDNGPQVLGCDYKLGTIEDTGKCLVVGSGIDQGISWLVFEVEGKRYRYVDSSPDRIELVDNDGNELTSHPIRHASEQCRPGGRAADVYAFANGDRICLYWN